MTAISNKRFLVSEKVIVVLLGLLVACVLALSYTGNVAYADSLTDLFKTKSFRGSTEALAGANWIGLVMHYVISWISFLGLCFIIIQKFLTLLYLSGKNLFDKIDAIKQGDRKKDMKSRFQEVKDTGGAAGIDVLIEFVLGLCPNIKEYSDYASSRVSSGNSEGGGTKLKEEDGCTQYMIKTAIPTIMGIFFFTIGASGTMVEAYGVVVDGMATAADTFVTKSLTGYVNRLVGEGNGYSFTLANSGTAGGELANDIAEEVYAHVLSYTDNSDSNFQNNLGRVVQESIAGAGDMAVASTGVSSGGILGGTADGAAQITELVKATQPNYNGDDEAGNLTENSIAGVSYDIIINNTPAGTGANETGQVWSVGELALAAEPALATNESSEKYIHVYLYAPSTSSGQYYLSPIEEDTTIDLNQ